MQVTGTQNSGARTELPAASPAPADRAAALEALLGDPGDRGNPTGNAALLAADARAEMSAPGERLLRDFGLDAEFVPRRLGGRLDSVDGLIRVLRPVFRRDAALGLGYGVTSFMAAVPVWAAGTARQRRWTADLLLGGGRLAFAYHELAHSNDFVRDEFSARLGAAGFVLGGSKPVINNVRRAEALVLYSRTGHGTGSRSHSVLMVDTAAVPPGRIRYLARHPMTGVRGVQAGGVAFTDAPLPGSALVGELGQGVELALRGFQITRSAIPAMVLSVVDTCLRTAVRFATDPGSGDGPGIGVRHATPVLAGAFADLLLCDALSLAATRGLSLIPEQTSVYAAAVKYLLPKVLHDTVYDLSIVLGSALYADSGPYAIFPKHVRDLPVISLGHAGTAACQSTIVPQLAPLADRAWFRGEPAPGELFQPGGPLPELDFDRVRPSAGQDALAAELVAAAAEADDPAVGVLARGFVAELRTLRERCLALPEDLSGPESPALADRYAHVLAAAACLGVWRQERRTRPTGFLAEPDWVLAALTRLAARLGGLPGLPETSGTPELPKPVEARMAAEVLSRFHAARGYDLYDTPLCG